MTRADPEIHPHERPPMTDLILTLNAGSSSIKFSAFAADPAGLTPRAAGQIENLGESARFNASVEGGSKTSFPLRDGADHRAGVAAILDWLGASCSAARVAAVGHRIVHGGPDFAAPLRLDAATLAQLRRFEPLAPLHQPHNLAGVDAALAAFPKAVQVGCFDTAFHRAHPYVADCFALPRRFYDEGVRRYGFHGLSYEYVSRRLGEVAPHLAGGRVIIAHLGNGASMCALRDGRSVASTMGFTALDGLPMGTRCGQIDPGAVLYLLSEKGMSPGEVSDLLYKQSGLKGMSGLTNDMRQLEQSGEPAAREAIDYFVARLRRELGGLAAAIGGLDALVFTGGIGENSASIRAATLDGMAFIGPILDAEANRAGAQIVSAPDSPVPVFVLKSDEERMIAEHTARAAGLPRRARNRPAGRKLVSAA
jgi:acetate kinase